MLPNTFVQSIARCSLSDDGWRFWDEEIEARLNDDYPGWQNPQGTTMVPSAFPFRKLSCCDGVIRGEEAEKRFFDLLKEFGSQSNEPMFVVHSYQFLDEVVNGLLVYGEHDFVVVHHRIGPIFFQVKASTSIGKFGGCALAKRQLKKDKKVTISHLSKFFGQELATDIVSRCPSYVVLPNCSRLLYPEAVGLFQEDCRDVQAFSEWWKAMVNVHPAATGFPQEIFEHLVKRFVGQLHTKLDPPKRLPDGIGKPCRSVDLLTTKQLKVLLGASPKEWITGPAGSGKTWLLLEKVVKLASDDPNAQILVLCYSNPLSQYFRKQFHIRLSYLKCTSRFNCTYLGITVMTYDKFLFHRLGISIACKELQKQHLIESACLKFKLHLESPSRTYDHIFIDEGQDLYGRWPELLHFFLHEKVPSPYYGDFVPTYFWVMYDPNQHVETSADHYESYQEQLTNSIKLARVLRNTENIYDLSKKYYSAPADLCQEFKLGHKVAGHCVFWDTSLPDEVGNYAEAGSEIVNRHVQKLIVHNCVKLKDICVLTKDVTTRDSLTKELKKLIPCQDAEYYIQRNDRAVIVESIRRFKGLESKVVILFDPVDAKTPQGWINDLLYIALSRCFCYLIIVGTKTCCECIKKNDFADLV